MRGELLDRQPWTTRNWVLRALQGVGSIAAGFTFATTNQDWIRGIGAYNAHGIPAGQTFWPDATVGQMNRISDYGFQVNKVIAKQSSDIVVAFFPIDRFLTPGLRKVFLKAPAVFFSPYAMLLDPKRPGLIDQILEPIFVDSPPISDQGSSPSEQFERRKAGFLCQLRKISGGGGNSGQQSACLDPSTSQATKAAAITGAPAPAPTPTTSTTASTDCGMSLPDACEIAGLLDRTSLNTVRVIVGGTMTVDVNKVPPQISEIDIDQDKAGTATWKKDEKLTGVIRGSFLSGGTPTITGGTPTITKAENVLQVTAVSEGSSDTELHFTITLKEDLPVGTTMLTFQVSKKSDGSTATTATQNYTILTPPKASSTAATGTSATTPEAKPQNTSPAGTTTEATKPAPVTPAKPATQEPAPTKKERSH